MKLIISNSYIALILVIVTIIIAAIYINFMINPLNVSVMWGIIILLGVSIELLCHEFIHSGVARLYGLKTEVITLDLNCCSCLVEPTRNAIVFGHIIISGFIFNLGIVSTVVFLIININNAYHENNILLVLGGLILLEFVINNVLHEDCDLQVYLAFCKKYSRKY